MDVQHLVGATGWSWLNAGMETTRRITDGCCCDLLSWVMATGQEGMAWVTVQTHMNVIAVASLHEFACVILPQGSSMDKDVLDKATAEGIAIISAQESSYRVCCRLFSLGIGKE
jgi:aspartate-semialdehyde dehydrogenase